MSTETARVIEPGSFRWRLRRERSTGGPWQAIAQKYDLPPLGVDTSEWSAVAAWLTASGATEAELELVEELHRRWQWDQAHGV